MSQPLRTLIGWWQLAFGVLGVVMLMLMLFDVPAGSLAMIQQYTGMLNIYLGAAFFSLATHAGYRLIRGRPGATGLALACQAPQVLEFAFLNGPHVVISAGPFLGVKLTSYSLGLSAGFKSSFFLGTMIQGPTFQVALNVIALIWTVALAKAWLGESDIEASTPEGAPLDHPRNGAPAE